MKKYNYLVFSLFYVFILFLLFTSILYSYFIIKIDVITNGVVLFGIISLVLYIYYSIKKKVFKIWNILILILGMLLYLSYYNAFDQYVALRGFYSGREGIFLIISYYIIFLLSTTMGDSLKNKIIKLLIIIGIFNVVYGIFQVFDIEYILGVPIARNWSAASGFLVNPDFFSSYILLMYAYCLVMFFKDKRISYAIYLFIFIFGIFLSGTMMSYFTMIILSILMFILLLVKKEINIKKIVLYIVFIVSSFLFINVFSDSKVGEDISNLNYEIESTLSGNLEDSFGTGRIYIWKEAFKYYPKYLYTGIGIDNFAFLGYDEKTYIYDSKIEDNIVYKAHNEYIQIIVCEGIVTFIVYFSFLILVILRGIKSSNKFSNKEKCGLLFAILAYLIQAFFNIRVVIVAPIFFMIMGFVTNENKELS